MADEFDTQRQPKHCRRHAVFCSSAYFDFLNREPDAAGLNFWTNQILSCGTDQQCIELKRKTSRRLLPFDRFQRQAACLSYGAGNDRRFATLWAIHARRSALQKTTSLALQGRARNSRAILRLSSMIHHASRVCCRLRRLSNENYVAHCWRMEESPLNWQAYDYPPRRRASSAA